MRAAAAVRALFLAALWAVTPAPGVAAEADDEAAAGATAPVMVDGETLFEVRGVRSYPAARRAADVAERIRALARDPSFDEARLTIQDLPRETRILDGEAPVLRIFDADAEIEGVDRIAVAEVYLRSIRTAVAGYRASRTPEALARSTRRIAVASLAAAVAVLLLVRARRVLVAWLRRREADRLGAVRISSFELVRAERIRAIARGVVRALTTLAFLALLFVYLEVALGALPWTRGAGRHLAEWVLAPVAFLFGGLLEKAPDLFFLAVLFLLARWVLRAVRLFFGSVSRGEVHLEGFEPDWADSTYKLARLGILALVLVVAYPYIPGSSSAAFQGVSIFAGVVFSLGSSSVVANLVAGYTLVYRRAFRPGDLVQIGDAFGTVARMRLQAVFLRTPKNEEVILPSSKVLDSTVVNYSALARGPGLILHTTVGIGYETPWRQVEAMLIEAARRTRSVLDEPAPFVLQLALGDFAVTYEINAYSDDAAGLKQRYSELHANILDVFNEHGVQIMTPAYEGDPEVPKVVPPERWYTAPAVSPAVPQRIPEGA